MDSRRYACIFMVLFSSLMYSSQAYRFVLGWVPYPSEVYNQWAGRMRFQVNDTIVFKYKKGSDSVLVVTKDDYYKCNTKYPILKMDGGDSTFKFDHSGPFYFISGNDGTCQKGQKLIVVVMAVRNKPTTPPAATPPVPGTQPPVPGTQPPVPAIQPPATSPVSPSPATHPPASSPTPMSTSPAPSTGSPVPSPTPARSPMSPAPAMVSPVPSPVPATSPTSPSPSAYTPGVSPSPAVTPSSEHPPAVSPSPEGVPTTPSPAGESPPSPPSYGNPPPSPPANNPPTSGNTPADLQSPPPGRSSSPSVSPSFISMSLFTIVLSSILGAFV